MKKSTLSLLLALAIALPPLLLACQKKESVDDFIFFEFHRIMRKKFIEYEVKLQDHERLDARKQVETCYGFARELKKMRYPDAPKSVLGYASNTCEYVPLLAKAAPHKGYRPENYAVELINRLDYKSFLNFTRQQIVGDDEHTLAQSSYIKPVAEGRFAAFRDDENEWHQGVCVIADADLNGNGKPDWVIVNEEHSNSGTLDSQNILIAYDVEPTGLIRASVDVAPARE